MNIIERVKKLNFPFGEYVIIGGGVLDALGIRATNDVDAAVTQKLFKELRATGEWEEEAKHGKIFLKRSDVDINPDISWSEYPTTNEEAISSAIVVDGIPFMNLEELKRFKLASGREKDITDIKLIEEYLQKIKPFINWAENRLGASVVAIKEPHGDQSTVYNLIGLNESYFLKIAPKLAEERERLEWFCGKLSVPKVIGFTHIGDKDVLLLSAIKGTNLAKLKKEWPADKVVNKLAEALLKFHAASAKNCPFGNPGPNKILVHGDACLPNFIFQGDEFSGYIDLGDARVDMPEVDLSAAVWSLQYNLGPGYGLKFLKEYGIKNASEEMAEKLRLHYEEMQKEWGLT